VILVNVCARRRAKLSERQLRKAVALHAAVALVLTTNMAPHIFVPRSKRPKEPPGPVFHELIKPDATSSAEELFCNARSLAFRLLITKRSLRERITPTVATVQQRRLAQFVQATASEKLEAAQMSAAEELIANLQRDLRAVHAKTTSYTRCWDGRLSASEVSPKPSRLELSLALVTTPRCDFSSSPLDLRALDLSNLDLSEASFAPLSDFSGAALEGANLTRVEFGTKSDLSSCNLAFAVGEMTNLASTNCSYSDLSHAKLTSADAQAVNLAHANLTRTDLSKSSLMNANLDNAVLCCTDLTSSDLTGASMKNVQLAGVVGLASCRLDNLRGASLHATNCSGLDLSGLDLTGTLFHSCLFLQLAKIDNLRGAVLTGCEFKGCDLSGVDMRGATIEGALFEGATLTKPANIRDVKGLESFEVGTMDTVQAGTIVAVHGFLICVTATHPTNPLYAYLDGYAGANDHKTNWAHVGTYDGQMSLWGDSGCMAGCFEKVHCRVVA